MQKRLSILREMFKQVSSTVKLLAIVPDALQPGSASETGVIARQIVKGFFAFTQTRARLFRRAFYLMKLL